jgi:hypothetical protein
MIAFRDFLRKKAEEEQNVHRRERRDQWIAAVRRLLDQLRAWLAEADPDKVLDVIPLEVQKIEPGLGIYTIPALKIGLGDAAVKVDPMGRNAVGIIELPGRPPTRAEGRVDITDDIHRYILYRLLDDGRDVWYALDEKFRPEPLDRGRLEAILQDLLS